MKIFNITFSARPCKEIIFHPFFFIFLILIGILPSIFLISFYIQKNTELNFIHTKLQALKQKSSFYQIKNSKEEKIINKMKGADPYYLDKYVESLSFLENEAKKWQRLSYQDQIIPAIEKRLSFLTSDKNKLSFAEGAIVSEGKFRETEEKQKHPVEINEEDLKKILCAIEGIKISSSNPAENQPQLLIKQFDLTKKTVPEINEKVFVLSMQLLKRELKSEINP